MAKIIRCWQEHLPKKFKDMIVQSYRNKGYESPWQMFLYQYNAKQRKRSFTLQRAELAGDDWFEMDENDFILLLLKYS
jgi:hypothetical protein